MGCADTVRKKWRKRVNTENDREKRGREEDTEKDEKESKIEKIMLRWEERKFMKMRGERDRK